MSAVPKNEPRPPRIGVLTTSRADYSIYRPVLEGLRRGFECELGLIVSGMHLVRDFGSTIDDVRRDGHAIWSAPEILLGSDSPAAVAKTMGLMQIALADAIPGL